MAFISLLAPAAQELKIGSRPSRARSIRSSTRSIPTSRWRSTSSTRWSCRTPSLRPQPGARAVVEADRRHDLGVQAAPRREVPRRLGLHRRGRRLHLRAHSEGAQQPRPLHDLHPLDEELRDRRSADLAHQHQRPRAAAAARSRRAADPVEEGDGGPGAPKARPRPSSMPATAWSAPARSSSSNGSAAAASSASATTPTGAPSPPGRR